MGYDFYFFFESFHTLTHPYAAPSVLHIAVLFSIGPAHELATLQLQTQIMDCVFLHRKSTHFKFTYVLFHNRTLDLSGSDSFSWLRTLKLKHAKREGEGSVQPEHKRLSAEGQFAKEGPGGKCLCLCWLRTQLQFNRLDLFQTSQPTNPVDTQGDGKRREKMIRAEVVKFCLLFEVGMNDSSLYTLRDWMWTFDTRQQSIMSLFGIQGVDPSLSVT